MPVLIGPIYGTPNADTLSGGDEDNEIFGYEADDRLYGNGGDDILRGHEGNDWLDGGDGQNVMRGGLGDDTYIVRTAGDVAIEKADGGVDTIISYVSRYTLAGAFENLVLAGSGDIDGRGNDLDNIMIGNAGANELLGGAGADHLYGGDGNDILNGGTGADWMEGGEGDDTYILGVGDTIREEGGGGYDTVISSIDFVLRPLLEDLILTGRASLSGGGNALNNRVTGNDGDNELRGGQGDDVLKGGAGDDVLIGGLGLDILTGGKGEDTFTFEKLEIRRAHDWDLITDFSDLDDRVDLRLIDADTRTAGDQAFHQVAALTGHAGELAASYNAARDQTTWLGDVDGDGKADFALLMTGLHILSDGWLL